MGDWSDKAEGAALIILGLAAVGTAAIVVTGSHHTPAPPVSPASSPEVTSTATAGSISNSLQRLTELLRPGGSAGTASAQATRSGSVAHGRTDAGAPGRPTLSGSGSAAPAQPADPRRPGRVARTTTVAVAAEHAAVVVNQPATISGSLTRDGLRPVTLERKAAHGAWVPTHRGQAKDGRFTLPVTTSQVGATEYRVVAPATGTHSQGVSTPVTVTVTDREGAGYALNDPPVRWNPCEEIGYVVNLNGVPAQALDDVRAAAERVRRASGLNLVYRGATDIVPGSNSTHATDALPPDVKLVVAWASPGTSSHLPKRGGSLAQTRLVWDRTPLASQGTPWHLLKQATITLDKDAVLPLGFGAVPSTGIRTTWGVVLLHHFGHAVGLDHPRFTAPLPHAPIMRESLTGQAAEWGPSDLVGLTAVGSGASCVKHRPPTGSPINADGSLVAGLGLSVKH